MKTLFIYSSLEKAKRCILTRSINQPTDEELLEAYRSSKDQNHIGDLYKRYMHLVYGLCLKYMKDEALASDMVMHIYEKLVNDTLKHDIKHFKSWLYMVSKNHCLMQLRKDQVRTKHESNYATEETVFMESPEVEHLNHVTPEEEKLQHLSDCLEQLKKEQKECVSLFYNEEKCYQEITDITGYALKKVKSYIQNGKRNLKICIEKKYAEQTA